MVKVQQTMSLYEPVVNVIFTALTVVVVVVLLSTASATEYCLTESFIAQCPDHEMILVERALFGRMELGRCVTRNYGHLGCSVDVLSYVDAACSGLRQCELSVSDPVLVRTKPCPPDFSSYLDATYRCVPGKSNKLIPAAAEMSANWNDAFVAFSRVFYASPTRPRPRHFAAIPAGGQRVGEKRGGEAGSLRLFRTRNGGPPVGVVAISMTLG
jgi:hypothetical protein